MYIPNNIIKSMLQGVYFIIGTAYAGKSTAVKLLAERYYGICCGENYHDIFMKHIDKDHQPNLSYFDTMKDWQEFISRTPDEYAAWIDGCSKEAESLEIIRLLQLVAEDKKIFVDTNISLETLREISDYHHIAVIQHCFLRIIRLINLAKNKPLLGITSVEKSFYRHTLRTKHHRNMLIVGNLSQCFQRDIRIDKDFLIFCNQLEQSDDF